MDKTRLKGRNTAIALTEEMIRMADLQEGECHDDSWLVIYGIIRDCAYEIRRAIENECSK